MKVISGFYGIHKVTSASVCQLLPREKEIVKSIVVEKQHEEEMINNYTSDIKAKIQRKKIYIFPVSTGF